MVDGSPNLYFCYIKTHLCIVSEFQGNIADMVRYVFWTRLGLKYLPVYYNRFVTSTA